MRIHQLCGLLDLSSVVSKKSVILAMESGPYQVELSLIPFDAGHPPISPQVVRFREVADAVCNLTYYGYSGRVFSLRLEIHGPPFPASDVSRLLQIPFPNLRSAYLLTSAPEEPPEYYFTLSVSSSDYQSELEWQLGLYDSLKGDSNSEGPPFSYADVLRALQGWKRLETLKLHRFLQVPVLTDSCMPHLDDIVVYPYLRCLELEDAPRRIHDFLGMIHLGTYTFVRVLSSERFDDPEDAAYMLLRMVPPHIPGWKHRPLRILESATRVEVDVSDHAVGIYGTCTAGYTHATGLLIGMAPSNASVLSTPRRREETSQALTEAAALVFVPTATRFPSSNERKGRANAVGTFCRKGDGSPT